jgi:hypothetical protein
MSLFRRFENLILGMGFKEVNYGNLREVFCKLNNHFALRASDLYGCHSSGLTDCCNLTNKSADSRGDRYCDLFHPESLYLPDPAELDKKPSRNSFKKQKLNFYGTKI